MDNGTNTRINRSENVWKTKDFPLGESQKMRVNCAFFVNSPRVFSVGKCHFFCRVCFSSHWPFFYTTNRRNKLSLSYLSAIQNITMNECLNVS